MSSLLVEMLKKNAVNLGSFTLASGKKSDFYIDIKKAYTKPEVLMEITREMARLIKNEKADKIAGVAVGAVPLVTALSLESGLPFLIVRKEMKGHGTGNKIEGELRAGENVIIVEDVTTTGESVLKAVEAIRDVNALCDRVVVVVDRNEGAVEHLASQGITLLPLTTSRELL
ncbi:MAG: orotate phosphoribosyltransferase [Candidatus Hydrothermarchaeota archaeon]|nr:orotate phosphoribosyltransferase [Candidatus Hydrothermarchaeota archaeon]